MTRNKITSYSGNLFSGTNEPTTDPGSNTSGGLQLSIADSDWEGTEEHSF